MKDRPVIKTASGHYIDLLDPKPEQIDLHAIASTLSKLCRFGGHCPQFYSVAEHCIHCASLGMQCGESPELVRHLFMHDSAEAYVGDMIEPIKKAVTGFIYIEDRVRSAIEAKYGLDFKLHAKGVMDVDMILLKAEKKAFWPDDLTVWPCLDGVPDVPINFQYWSPLVAETEFTTMARRLGLFHYE